MRLESFRELFFSGVPRYQWLENVGRGGMGIVFKAFDRELQEDVAIKVLSPELDDSGQSVLTRFKNEISLNRRIKHPNVARIHDFGMSNEFPYITMEFVNGTDLRTVVEQRGRLPSNETLSILRQIALGTHAAHRMGIIHRDLKSQNVMIDSAGAVAILDFGLARAMIADRLTVDDVLVGTPQYMSPEQALGKDADPRSDVYAIGIIAFELLVGQVPFRSESPIATALMHVNELVPGWALDGLGLPPGLKGIVLRSLEKHPDQRYQSAADLEVALARIQGVDTARRKSSGKGIPIQGGQSVLPQAPAPAPGRGPADYAEAGGGRLTPLRPVGDGAPIRLPTPAVVYAPPIDPGEATMVKRSRPLVLVVEDDATMRSEFVYALGSAGCDTLEAADGQSALELVMKKLPDLVLLDVSLPGMDGFDVARVIKSQAAFASMPIVLANQEIGRHQFAFGVQSGATEFITKPIAADTLAWRIWNVLKPLGFTHPSDREAVKESMRERLGLNDGG